MEKFGVEGAVSEEFVEPEIEPFKSHGYLKSWLQDEQGRDQAVLHFGESVGVYWNKRPVNQNQLLNQEKVSHPNMPSSLQKVLICFPSILKVFNLGVVMTLRV